MYKVLSLCCLAATGVFSVPAAGADKPNVIVFLADDLGWTDLGCYGSDFYETPNIDRLAERGVRFTNAYSACTVCSPSRAALLTGKYPARLNVTDWIPGHERDDVPLRIPDWTMRLEHDQVTLAEALKEEGYATGHVGKWHLGDPSYYPEHQGFDVNVAGTLRGQPPKYFWPYKDAKWDLGLSHKGEEGEYLTDRLTDEAVELLRGWWDQPFFLYFPYYTVHTPLQAKESYEAYFEAKREPGRQHHNATYASMIRSLDESVGRVLDALDELGLMDNTIVIFTSDNGGLSHVRDRYVGVTNNAPLRAGKGSAYEGGVRVPFIAYVPGVTTPGTVVDEPVAGIDIYPTILELTGAAGNTNHNRTMDGTDLTALLRDAQTELGDRSLFWHYPHYHPGGATPYSAVRDSDWKLIEFFEDDRLELYNLSNDLGESDNVIDEFPEKAASLYRRLLSWRADVDAQMPLPNPDYTPTDQQ